MNFNSLKSSLKAFKPHEIVFVGIGNEYRGDDSAGLVFLNKLKQNKYFSDSHFINAGISPENYLHLILSYTPSVVVFIDAVRYTEASGFIGWLESGQVDSLEISTHAFSLDLIQKYLVSCKEMEIKYLGIGIGAAGSFGKSISLDTLESIKRFFDNTLEDR